MSFSIVLSGGGARGAYQAGSIRALYEIGKSAGNLKPFENIVGISAGAINGSYIAAGVEDLDQTTGRLCETWQNLRPTDVFRTDAVSLSRTALKLLRGLSLGGLSSWMRPRQLGLLNTKPLAQLIDSLVDFQKIKKNVAEKRLHAFSVTATDYSTSLGVSFFTGADDLQPWKRYRRIGMRAELTADHVMASASIPIFFPPWPVGNRYYGDGCLRNTAPLSPAIHIGSQKMIVIGVRKWKEISLSDESNLAPSLGRIMSVLINAVLMDAIELDLERIRVMNETLHLSPEGPGLRRLEVFYANPSVLISELATIHMDDLPPMIRLLIGGLGSAEESSEILSYLSFERSYCTKLVELGYNDLMAQKESLLQYLSS